LNAARTVFFGINQETIANLQRLCQYIGELKKYLEVALSSVNARQWAKMLLK